MLLTIAKLSTKIENRTKSHLKIAVANDHHQQMNSPVPILPVGNIVERPGLIIRAKMLPTCHRKLEVK
ncbi:hypothetical protein T265_02891 [Opisthorchis viverrini]|uniref:Uncharacterized protein n=1 Tax=Opisthorchis viverrini TaxID=6198 RepID=A0A075A587_OPIVI|nr:hypothetical protein T265_02891 [Opisthorchis viverrini]KER30745.1 hypothetical protein T265_02891 [Opisthorchis viverrini]